MARFRKPAVLGALALLAACGGGGTHGGQHVLAPTESFEPPTLRALLQRYSPSGHAIVTTCESMAADNPQGFDHYVKDTTTELVVTHIVTGVHELTHGYAGRMASRLLAERKLPAGLGADAILADQEPWLVRFTPTFPSIEMDGTFPADARSPRYGVYITPENEPSLGTQSLGIYGLLDEFAAYYQDARTTVDFWPYVRDEAPVDARVIMNYAVLLDDLQRSHVEWQLYILHYLIHARDHHPDVYQAVMANDDFRRAFIAVVDGYAVTAAAAARLEPAVYDLARSRGVHLERQGVLIAIDGNPQRPADAPALRAVHAHLAAELYRSQLAAIRRGL